MRTPYTGEVAIILTNALAELEQDQEFDRDVLMYLQSCYDTGKLANEAALQKYLAALIQEGRE